MATTRPETILGDTAVAVHPEDERYKQYIGRECEVPMSGRRIKIIADDYVDMEFGTGALKITPGRWFMLLCVLLVVMKWSLHYGTAKHRLMHTGLIRCCNLQLSAPPLLPMCPRPYCCCCIAAGHDPNDYEIGKRVGLEIINIMNKDGSMNANAGMLLLLGCVSSTGADSSPAFQALLTGTSATSQTHCLNWWLCTL